MRFVDQMCLSRLIRLSFFIAAFTLHQTSSASAACGGHGDKSTLLVSTAWLADHLHDRNLTILSIGQEADYQKGHIPGALYLSYDDIHLREGPTKLTVELPPMAQLRDVFRKLGVSNDTHVVLYFANQGFASIATRAFLTLDAMGIGSHTSLLDGGMPVWQSEGRPLSTEVRPITAGNLDSSSTPRFRKLPVGNSLAFQKKCSDTPSLRWLTGDKFSMSATWGARRRRMLEKPCPPTPGAGPRKTQPLPLIVTAISTRLFRSRMTSAHSSFHSLDANRSSSSLRNSSARNEQKTCPRIASSQRWKIGRVSSNDFIDRNTSSTIQSCLYFSATSLVGRSVFVVSTHLPS